VFLNILTYKQYYTHWEGDFKPYIIFPEQPHFLPHNTGKGELGGRLHLNAVAPDFITFPLIICFDL